MQSICGKYEVKGFPTIKHFGEDKSKPADYQGAREAPAIVKFGQEAAGAGGGGGGRLVQTLTYLETYYFLHSSGTPTVLLLTAAEEKAKATAPSWLNSLAVKYKDGKKRRVHIGFADGGKEPAIASRFGVDKLPAVIVAVPGGEEAFFVRFPDKLPTNTASAVKAVKSFVDDAIGGVLDSKLREPLPAFPPPDVPRKQASVSFSHLNADNLHSACFGGAKGACVLALVHAPGGELAPAVHDVLESAAKKYRNDPVAFAWLDASGQPEFAAAFGINSVAPTDLPRLMVVKPGKRPRAALLPAGALTSAAIESLVDKTLGGDLTFVAVKGGLPEIVSPELRAAMAAAEADDTPASAGSGAESHDEL